MRAMAEELGIGKNTYVNFETGRSRLFNRVLGLLAARLGMSAEELLFGPRPDEQLLRDSVALDQWRRSLVDEYEQRISALQERLDAAGKVIEAQGTTIRTLTESNQYLMAQLRKDE